MFGRIRTRLRPRSLPTPISLLALSIVLTGTAWAATGQLANIADGTNAARVAKVDVYGNLRTAGSVTSTEVIPKSQFRSAAYFAPRISVHGHVVSGTYSGVTTAARSEEPAGSTGKVVVGQLR